MARETVEMVASVRAGRFVTVDALKYYDMREAYLAVVPSDAPGLTYSEIKHGVLPLLPEETFPGGEKAGWWIKGIQLDLEAKGIIVRHEGRPLRWYKRTA